jgi:MoxR-like ATPase
MSVDSTALGELAERYAALRATVAEVVIGQEEAVKLSLVTVLCGGHSLYEGVPGLAKTLLVRALAATLDIDFGRIQFTADLMPSDIVGSVVLGGPGGDLTFRRGPIFTDFLLADEINRAPAKTQAALLEAMQEAFVTVDGARHPLGEYFTVFATQNPIEQEGTYPLPEAELDRFQLKIELSYPSADEELQILRSHHTRTPDPCKLAPVLDRSALDRARDLIRRVVVRDEVLGYAAAIIRATREDPAIAVGASPRAGMWLVRSAKAMAALDGRDFVLPEDVQRVLTPCLRHRIVLDAGAQVEGQTASDVLGEVLRTVPVPK